MARAGSRCEYCGLSHRGQAATFHVDHVAPVAAGGATVLANLALACIHCSLRKGTRQTARDPATGLSVRLFHPHDQQWNHQLSMGRQRGRGAHRQRPGDDCRAGPQQP